MKKLIALIFICLWTTVLWASGKIKLNVKTGLWQTTTTNTFSGTPRTVTYKTCLTPEKLAEDPFTDRSHGDNAKCEETLIKSTATDLELREVCSYGNSKTDVHLSFRADTPEHVTGSGATTATADGRTRNSTMKMDSKWISASCQGNKK